MRLLMKIKLVALLLSMGACLCLLSGHSGYSSGKSWIEVNGATAIIPIVTPVLIVLATTIFPDPRGSILTGAAAVKLLFTVVAGFTIGLFYAPATIALIRAGVVFLNERHQSSGQ